MLQAPVHHANGIDFEPTGPEVFLIVRTGNQLELGDLNHIFKTREYAEMVAENYNKAFNLSGDDQLIVRQMAIQFRQDSGTLYLAKVRQ